MTFLTSQPDLSGTIYEQQSLREPREYLAAEIEKVAPGWLDDPQGLLGDYWKRDDTYATCNLIWLAQMINSISQNVTQRSVTRLQDKFKALLNPPSLEKFTEHLTELEVAWALVDRVSPLALDPLVSEEAFASGARPSTPDFAFQLSKGLPEEEMVFVEVTVWHVDILDKWDRAVDQMLNTLQNRLNKQGKFFKLQLQLPLQEFEAKHITQMTNRAWSKISSSSGPDQLTLVDKGTIRWTPYSINTMQKPSSSLPNGLETPLAGSVPAFGSTEFLFRVRALDDSPAFMAFTPSEAVHSSNLEVDRAVVKEPDIAILSENDVQKANALVVKSFRQKLKRKRVQFPHDEPYLLFIKPGHFRLLSNGLIEMIEQQIWRKPDYSWVTGIVLFTSRQGFLGLNSGPKLLVFLNPKARCQASDALKTVIDGKAQFHYDCQP